MHVTAYLSLSLEGPEGIPKIVPMGEIHSPTEASGEIYKQPSKQCHWRGLSLERAFLGCTPISKGPHCRPPFPKG